MMPQPQLVALDQTTFGPGIFIRIMFERVTRPEAVQELRPPR